VVRSKCFSGNGVNRVYPDAMGEVYGAINPNWFNLVDVEIRFI
jgi:hypothetical protein